MCSGRVLTWSFQMATLCSRSACHCSLADDEDNGAPEPGGAGGDQQPPAAAQAQAQQQQQQQQPSYMLDAVEEDPDKELHAFEVEPAKVHTAGLRLACVLVETKLVAAAMS